MDDVLTRLDQLRDGQAEILSRLDHLQTRVDEQQRSANVQSEAVLQSLVGLHGGIKGLRESTANVDQRVTSFQRSTNESFALVLEALNVRRAATGS